MPGGPPAIPARPARSAWTGLEPEETQAGAAARDCPGGLAVGAENPRGGLRDGPEATVISGRADHHVGVAGRRSGDAVGVGAIVGTTSKAPARIASRPPGRRSPAPGPDVCCARRQFLDGVGRPNALQITDGDPPPSCASGSTSAGRIEQRCGQIARRGYRRAGAQHDVRWGGICQPRRPSTPPTHARS